jgi:sulfoxide reductase heme-binding subunit YedZ
MKIPFSDRWLRLLVHAAALQPLASMVYAGLADNLTVNPIQDLTLRTGKAALLLLIASLSVSPLSTWLGLRQMIPHRRTLGLYAFFYASLHLSMFVLVDFGLNWGLIWKAVLEKRFVVAGFSAFLILLALATTSFKWWQRRMGKRWKQLHRLVYVAALLVIVHYVWLVKSDIRIPLEYGAVVGLLLIARLPPLKRLGANWRANLRKALVKNDAPVEIDRIIK